jgi:hypothetical protein
MLADSGAGSALRRMQAVRREARLPGIGARGRRCGSRDCIQSAGSSRLVGCRSLGKRYDGIYVARVRSGNPAESVR